MRLTRLLPLAALVAAACENDPSSAARALPSGPLADAASSQSVGQVYTSTNSTSGNAVLVYDRAADGSLSAARSYATGGAGTGAGTGSQGTVTLAPNGRSLVVVDAGSDEVSSFVVRNDGTPALRSTVPSGGTTPISVTIHGSLVYVLNGGGAGNIAGFTLDEGVLTPIAGSSRPLSGSGVGPAQIQFSPNGRYLVVTEKVSNKIDVYAVGSNGLVSGPTVYPSHGMTPFGFAFRGGVLVVSEAFGGAPDASAVSTYELQANGTLALLDGSVPTTETAACWVAITGDDRYAYTANAGSASITGFAMQKGHLSILDADGVTGSVGAGHSPIDVAVTHDSRFLYQLTGGSPIIAAFEVASDGSLTSISGGASGLPVGSVGLAVR